MTVLSSTSPESSAVTAPTGTGDAEAMNSVLGKARLIIEAFTAEDDSLSLAELVRRSGVAKASVHRLAQELLAWGLLERAGNRYRLGLRLFEIGQRVPRQRILREAALPYMEDLLLVTQETVHFAIHEGLDVLYVEKLMVHRGLKKQSRVAGRLPLYCTATGKVVLAFSPPALFHEVLRGGLTPLTNRTVTQPGRLQVQLDRIRAERLAIEVEETRLGYTSVAVPVFGDAGALAGALSITAPTFRLNHMNHGRFTGALRTAALGVSRALQTTG
ncbi:IclR family transcriptional regulator [Rhizohabitans arisaemae]|uniref:IclR family transcriptional regulator n=1 Tax=Rhizohabitans arisaemae TaxID=2720610 RepID=UPI0024B19B11|nr:IclR family transcriptional regulator [Rhizohabitans arisaemae]